MNPIMDEHLDLIAETLGAGAPDNATIRKVLEAAQQVGWLPPRKHLIPDCDAPEAEMAVADLRH